MDILAQQLCRTRMQTGIRRLVQRRFKTTTNAKSEAAKPRPVPVFDPGKAPIQIRLPGPSWIWKPFKPFGYPLAAYNRIGLRKPYLTQFITSLIIYSIGDFSSQYISRPRSTSDDESSESVTLSTWYDPHKTLRALIIGGTFAIPGYHWFMWLSQRWTTLPHLLGLTARVALNTAVFAPVISSYFFVMQSVLSGQGGSTIQGKAEAAWIRVRDTMPKAWLNGCAFWPIVMAFSFTFVPPVSRSVFAGFAAVLWQTYLGILNNKARRVESEHGEAMSTAPAL